jgi:hypothetical protein
MNPFWGEVGSRSTGYFQTEGRYDPTSDTMGKSTSTIGSAAGS